jgi:serine/threonine protein kinase
MKPKTISEFLAEDLAALPLLDGRFESIKLVNIDVVTGNRRGVLSIVFRAFDRDSQKDVALKFFDPMWQMDVYRLNAFRREHDILKSLVGIDRCLQVLSGLNTYVLNIPTATGFTIPLSCEYFAIEWIDEEIDQYFLCQTNFTAAERLRLFSLIAGSVEVLHRAQVFHRDLKPDNLRRQTLDGISTIVAIDLGTAARFSSAPISPDYDRSVGAPAYASPEARCGLAGNRRLAPYTDLFALGCILFELFNKDLYLRAFFNRNSHFDLVLATLLAQVNPMASEADQVKSWIGCTDVLSKSIVPVPLNGHGGDVPLGISNLLNELVLSLTHVDFRQRPSIAWVRKRVASALTVLANQKLYEQRRSQQMLFRKNRALKIAKRIERLEYFLAQKKERTHALKS